MSSPQRKPIPQLLHTLGRRFSRLSVGSRSDWLAGLIEVTRAATAAGELAPIPYIKGAAGSLLLLLQTVEKVDKNKDDARIVLESVVNLIVVIREDVRRHGDLCRTPYADLCKIFAKDLDAITSELNAANRDNENWFRQFLKSSSIQDMIVSHKRRMQELRANFTLSTVVETQFAVTAMRGDINQLVTAQALHVEAIPCRPTPMPSPRFTGRAVYLSRLRLYFSAQPTAQTQQRRQFLLYGMGGAGKTQICLKFVEESSDLFKHIFWVDASSTETLSLSLRGIAQHQDAKAAAVEPSVDSVVHWLSCNNNNWLLVFDNVVVRPEAVTRFVPAGVHGSVLFTSRNPDMRSLVSSGASADVDRLDDEDAISLLLDAAFLDVSCMELRQAAQPIVVELCGLPLAVDQAGALIGNHLCGIHDYLKIYSKHHKRLMAHQSFAGASMYGRAVYASWDVSYAQMEARAAGGDDLEAQAAKSAIFLLQIFSFFHHGNITEEIFRRAAEAPFNAESDPDGLVTVDYAPELLQVDEDGVWDPLCFREGIRVLHSCSLVKMAGAAYCYSVHPLVHQWARDRMLKHDEDIMHKSASALLTSSITAPLVAEDYEYHLALIPHIRTCTKEALGGRGMKKHSAVQYECYASVLLGGGYWKHAEELILQGLEIRTLLHGAEALETLSTKAILAAVLLRQGRWDEAEKLEIQVLKARQKLLGAEHPQTMSAMGCLGSILENQGRWHEAEELQVQALKTSQKVFGADHQHTLSVMSDLALALQGQGRWKEAEEIQVQVLNSRQKLLGAKHPDTWGAMNNLALTLQSQGRWNEAKELKVQVLTATKQLLGADHPSTLTVMANLAIALQSQGRWNEAEELKIQVFQARQKLLGAEHPDTLSAMNNLAATLCSQGRWNEAEKLVVQVLKARQKLLGADHPDTLTAMNNLAATFLSQGRWNEAEELQVQVLKARQKLLGAEHPATLSAMGNLAEILKCQGRWNEAEKLEVPVLKATEKLLGADHPDTLSAINNLASTLHRQERWNEAEELRIQVLRARQKLLGAEHPDTLSAMHNLAVTLQTQGKLNEAEELKSQVLKARQRLLGAEHPDTLSAMANLSTALHSQGRWNEAEELQVQVLKAMQKNLGAEHPDTLSSMVNLATTLYHQGRWDEAEKLEVQVLKARQTVLGAEHPDTLSAMGNLTATLRSLGRANEAQELEVQRSSC